MADVENNPMPLRNGTVIQRIGLDDREQLIGLRAGSIQTIEQYSVVGNKHDWFTVMVAVRPTSSESVRTLSDGYAPRAGSSCKVCQHTSHRGGNEWPRLHPYRESPPP